MKEAEGYKLHLSLTNPTGYLGVRQEGEGEHRVRGWMRSGRDFGALAARRARVAARPEQGGCRRLAQRTQLVI